MQKILNARASAAGPFQDHQNAVDIDTQALARTMRTALRETLARLQDGSVALRSPAPAGEWAATGGGGHFHLCCELFVQLQGWTHFHFPHAELILQAGEILLLPARLLHAERSGAETTFRNLVVYAEETVLTCHLANERAPGEPGVEYLEARQLGPADRIQHWLDDAVKLAPDPADALVETQRRALVLSAVAGVLRALDQPAGGPAGESPYLALARLHIQNRLGDPELSIASLARLAGCSADYLSRLFQQAQGEPLLAHITRLRLARAARLLSESELSAKQIAWSCGFATQSYFIQRFKQHFGVTPKLWRGHAAAGRGQRP